MEAPKLATILVIVLAVGVAMGYVVANTSRAGVPSTSTAGTVTVTSTVTETKAVTETVTSIREVVKTRLFRPELVADILVADRSSLPPSSFVQVDTWRSHAPYTLVVFSPDSSMFAVTVTRYVEDKPVSEVRVYTIYGEELWRFETGSGYIRSLAWSSDGKILFVGENSIEGTLVALDASTGEQLWSYKTSSELGTSDPSQPRYYWPTIYSIEYSDGKVYASACRTVKKPKYGKICAIYCFDARDGSLVWRYPREGFIDTMVPEIKLSPDGHYLAAATWYYKGEQWKGGVLLLLDTTSGSLVASFDPGTRSPFRWAGSWSGVDWLDEKHIAYVLDDGRLYVLEAPSLNTVEEVDVTSPLPALVLPRKANTTEEGYVYAFSGYNRVVKTPTGHTLLLVRTSNTYGVTAAGKSAKPTINHPDANSIFIYEWRDGGLAFIAKYPLRGKPSYENWASYSPEHGLLAVPVGHDYVARSTIYTGIYILNLTDINAVRSGEALALTIKPPADSGVVIGGGISPDGARVVAITYPVNAGTADSPVFIGDYRILIYGID
ncbi:hypothetical protein Pyrde_1419 [Pyrodictium delaneyi]|uniref:Pyrrolo-quinoline quinone repeat domain-containing protein n=1 Tax=Pyrodictium delaneyi TaxID=1273541 RepID=A0A0P0N4Y9_9CREN|nr:PQQ-binding-like beta-propeller repeat protein [Pyrodictium delaneyi]ALL01463.1 hypothetical protein Pyrde_1419 [Pyrodictium delaneyi]OWJ54623.1 hypothetical protein Pdsh_06270 [Pyrodictium delaneyi]